MPTDPSMAILFLVFLALFVLLGTSPVLHRLFALVGGLLRDFRSWQGGGVEEHLEREEWSERSWDESRLNDYENIVLRKLAMVGNKSMSRKALARALYFKPSNVAKALTSLRIRGLVRSTKPHLIGEYFSLSVRGREYCVELDFIPRYHEHSRGKGGLFLSGEL